MKTAIVFLILALAGPTFADDLFQCRDLHPTDPSFTELIVKVSHNEQFNEDILSITSVLGDSSKVDRFFGLDCRVETSEGRDGTLNVNGHCEQEEDVPFVTFIPSRMPGTVVIQLRDEEAREMITLGKSFSCRK